MAEASAARGRAADAPSGIPARGWKDIAWRLFKEVSNDRVLLIAAGVTFYLLLALGPLLGALVSLYGLLLDPGDIAAQAEALAGVVPGGGVSILTEQIERLSATGTGTLGVAFAVSLGIALWSSNAGMKAMFEAMNVAYDEDESRGFVRLTLVSLCFTIATLVGIGALAAFNVAFTASQEGDTAVLSESVVQALTAAIALLSLIGFMAALYRYGPSRENPRWRWITPGAVFAGLAIVAFSALFTWYVANFGSYNETYGSLGALVGFLTWLWLVVTVLMMGGELNAEMEHQTRRDTTTGEREPLGQRGATVADEIGRRFGQSDDAVATRGAAR